MRYYGDPQSGMRKGTDAERPQDKRTRTDAETEDKIKRAPAKAYKPTHGGYLPDDSSFDPTCL